MKLLLLLSAVSAMSVCIPNEFCIHGNVSQTNIIYTVHSKFNGWNAVGWGNTMTDTPLVVVWKNGQDYMISDRRCTEKVQPLEYAPAANTTLMELFVPAPTWASTAFSFTRPLVSDNWNILKTTEYFYAAAENTPENPQNRDATIGMHSTKSLFGVVDFTVASNTNTNKKKDNGAILQLPDDWTYTKMLMIHAFMMMFAWLICPLASGFILKFFRSKSFSRYAHMGIMSIGTGLTSIFAFFVVLLYKEGGHFTSSNGSSAHSIIGLVVVLGTVGQIGIGILKQTYSDPKLKATLVKAHKWTGITLFIFALVTIALGLQLFGSFSKKNQVPLIIAFMLVILLGGSAFFFGSFFLSPKDDNGRKRKSFLELGKDYLSSKSSEYARSRSGSVATSSSRQDPKKKEKRSREDREKKSKSKQGRDKSRQGRSKESRSEGSSRDEHRSNRDKSRGKSRDEPRSKSKATRKPISYDLAI